jgi:hypothetical protein
LSFAAVQHGSAVKQSRVLLLDAAQGGEKRGQIVELRFFNQAQLAHFLLAMPMMGQLVAIGFHAGNGSRGDTCEGGHWTLLLTVDDPRPELFGYAGAMPRQARSVSAARDVIYHVMNRGNCRRDVFQKPGDFTVFVTMLE